MSRAIPGTLVAAPSHDPSTPNEAVRVGSPRTEDSDAHPGAFATWRRRIRPRRLLGLLAVLAVAALAWFWMPELVFALLSGLGAHVDSGTSTTVAFGGEQVASVLRMWLPIFSIYWFMRRDMGQMEDRINRKFDQVDQRASETKAELLQRIAEVNANLVKQFDDTKIDLVKRNDDTKADLVKQIEDTKAGLSRQVTQVGKRIDRMGARLGRVEDAVLRLARGSHPR